MAKSHSGDPSTAPGTPRPRASDAQRTAVWAALDAAFADGRLDRLEHLERTRVVSGARFVDELRPLVADLRGGHDDLGLGEPDQQGPHPDAHTDTDTGTRSRPGRRQSGRSQHRRRRALIAGSAVAVAALAAAGAFAASVSVDPSSSETVITQPGPLHSADGMSQMLSAAQTEFGGLAIDSLSISGDNAVLMYEDPSEPGKRLSHVFRGEWREPTFSSRTDSATFRLDAVDPAVIMAAIDAAPEELDMDDDARTSHVTVNADVLAQPEYRVVLSDDGDLGTVTVGVDGAVRDVDQPD